MQNDNTGVRINRMLANKKKSTLEVINHQQKFEASNQAKPIPLKVPAQKCNMLVHY